MPDKKPKPKCPGCKRDVIKKAIPVCNICHREVYSRSALGKKSRAKGCGFENDVAKMFSEWWGEVRSFRRTPMSGAWSKAKAPGDLVVPDEFLLEVECKNFEGWELGNLLTSVDCKLWKHWKQARSNRRASHDPILVFTRNHQPAWFMMRVEDYKRLQLSDPRDAMAFFTFSNPEVEPSILVVGLLEDLLSCWVPPKH